MPGQPTTRPAESSFARGLRVLLLAAGQGEVTAAALASELEMPLSTVYRYLRTLRELGFLVEHDGRFGAGEALLSQQRLGLPSQALVRLARPILERLARTTGETVVLTVRVGSLVLCLDQIESEQAVRVAFRIGQLLPLHAGAGSRVLLAYAPREVVDGVLQGQLAAFTPGTPDRDRLARQLAQIRTSGMAVSRGEFITGAFAVAAAVQVEGVVPCALTVAAPEARSSSAWQLSVKERLRETVEELAAVLAS